MQKKQGFTLIEMLVTLSILGIALGIGISFLKMPSSRLYANDLKAMIQQARFESIKRNAAVAVVWDSVAQNFTIRVLTDLTQPCSNGIQLKAQPLSEYRNLKIESTTLPGNGVIWLPTGQIRGCNNPLADSVTTISDSRSTLLLTISRAGRVTIE
jgi:prepilin-type N-terminal cleavage/methylation domain-containing protein